MLTDCHLFNERVDWPDQKESESGECEQVGIEAADLIPDELLDWVYYVECPIDHPQTQNMEIAEDGSGCVDLIEGDDAVVSQ